jgi:hypothetical protein
LLDSVPRGEGIKTPRATPRSKDGSEMGGVLIRGEGVGKGAGRRAGREYSTKRYFAKISGTIKSRTKNRDILSFFSLGDEWLGPGIMRAVKQSRA